MKFFKRTIQDYTDSELNLDFSEWQKYAQMSFSFPAYRIVAPDLRYAQDEIQCEIFRRQNAGTRAKSLDVYNTPDFKPARGAES